MIQRPFRYYYLRVTRQRGTPENVAWGMAIGVFFGLFIPPFGQLAMALFAATLMKVNRVTAFIGTWISNPFTYFIFVFYLIFGQWITGIELKTYLVKKPKDTTEQTQTPAPAKVSSMELGSELLAEEEHVPKSVEVWIDAITKNGFPFLFKLLVVWLVSATPVALLGAVLSYHLTRLGVESFRRKQLARRAKKRAQRERKAAEDAAIRGIHMGLDEQ